MPQQTTHDSLVIERLWQRYRENHDVETRNLIAIANRRLIGRVLDHYFKKLPEGIKEDMLQVGFFGLLTAIERFNPELGYKFSTYAFPWIRQAMSRWVYDNGYEIRLPVHLHEELSRLRKEEALLVNDEQRHNNINEELASRLSLSTNKVNRLKDLSGLLNLVELDKPVSDEDSSNLADFLDDKDLNNPLHILIEVEGRVITRGNLSKAISTLPRRSAQMLILYYCDNLTLDGVAKRWSITRERVRQINAVSIKKLRIYFGVDPDTPTHSYFSGRELTHTEIMNSLSGETMRTEPNENQLTKKELGVAQMLWPLLSEDSSTKLNFDAIATDLSLAKTNLSQVINGLSKKGVLKRGEKRGHYMRGTSVVTVGDRRRSSSETVDLNTAKITPDTTTEEDSPSSGSQTPSPKTTPTKTVSIDQTIQQLEEKKEEIDRRLQILYEARTVINEPL